MSEMVTTPIDEEQEMPLSSTVLITALLDATSWSTADLRETDDNIIVIIASSVAGITIIVVVAMILCFIARRLSRQSKTGDDAHTKQNKNQNENAEPHDYVEVGESDSAMTNKDNTGALPVSSEYSYADLILQQPKQVVTERLDVNKLTAKDMQIRVNEEKTIPVEGFLAPDYGELMGDDVSQAKGGDTNNSPYGIHAIYSQVRKPTVSSDMTINSVTEAHTLAPSVDSPDNIDEVKSVYNDDLQLHENEVYVHTTYCNQLSDPPFNITHYKETYTNDSHGRDTLDPHRIVTGSSLTDCGYYNVGGTNVDDQEMFENSAYEST